VIPRLSVLACAALLIGASGAGAGDGDLYVQLTGEAVDLRDTDSSGEPGIRITTDYELGYGIQGALGYDVPGLFRAELEAGYRRNEVHALDIDLSALLGGGLFSGFVLDGHGHLSATSLMLNGYADFGIAGPWQGYLMAGGGLVHLVADVNTMGEIFVDDRATVWAYQLGLGVSRALDDNTTVVMGYRFLHSDRPGFRDAAGTRFTSEYRVHAFDLGLRYAF